MLVADTGSRAARSAERRLPRPQVEYTPSWAEQAADMLALVEEAGKWALVVLGASRWPWVQLWAAQMVSAVARSCSQDVRAPRDDDHAHGQTNARHQRQPAPG